MGECVETRGPSGVDLDQVAREAFREDPALARHLPASETPCLQMDSEPPAMSREIAQGPQIATVDRRRRPATGRTRARPRHSMGVNRNGIGADLVMIDDQSGRDEPERRCVKAHAIWPSKARSPTPLESLRIHRPLHQKCARAPTPRLFTATAIEAGFDPRPRERATGSGKRKDRGRLVSIHAPVRGRLVDPRHCEASQMFRSTPP